MDTKEIEIFAKDIYTGKLDARFEELTAFQEFNMNFPSNIDINSLIKGDKYYITGNKGTGKTALLLYLSNMMTQNDQDAVCSTILFKTDYNATERIKIQTLERKIIDTLDISSTQLYNVQDFTNIWLLTLYLKIVLDNKRNNYKLFTNDTNWDAFENLVLRLSNTAKIGNRDKLTLLESIPTEIKYTNEWDRYTISEDYIPISDASEIQLVDFNDALVVAEYLFKRLDRRSAPYFIYIDELETYCGNKSFRRDIQMIHDWIEVAWKINAIIREASYRNMKVVLSVRTEMLRSIEKHLGGDELNKKIGSYRIIVDWKSKYLTGVRNPLFAIWLKRIAIAKGDNSETNYQSIREEWFPASVGEQDTIDFILERTWNKPRDIIRYMTLSVKNASESKKFNKSSIVNVLEDYSEDSKSEIMEEMSALYSSEQIDLIFSSLKKFKNVFSKEEYISHIKDNFSGYDLFDNVDYLLEDLYRFGILGCQDTNTGVVNWYYQGETTIYKGPKWRYYVHLGLRPSLGLENIVSDNINLYDIIAVPLNCTVTRANRSFIFVKFPFDNRMHDGAIHVSKWDKHTYIEDVSQCVHAGENITAYALYYDNEYSNWKLTCQI